MISSDLGKNWRLLTGPFIDVYDFHTIDSLNFLITTDNGFYKSSDGGYEWILFAFEGSEFHRFLVSNDKKTIITANSDGLIFSTNNGLTWDKSKDSFGLERLRVVYSIAQDSSNNFFVAPFRYGVYRTSDLTTHWTQINNGFSAWQSDAIAFDTKNDIILTAFGIYKTNLKDWKNFNYLGFQYTRFGSVAINKNNDIFVGTISTRENNGGINEAGVYRSTDNGASWQIFNINSIPMASVKSIIINAKGMLFCTMGAGSIARSNNNGETWSIYDDDEVYGMSLSINDEGHIFTFDSGTIFRSTNDGATWDKIFQVQVHPTFYDDRIERVIFNNKTKTAFYGNIHYETIDNEIGNLKTTDNGRTWFKDSTNYDDFVRFEVKAVDSLYCWIGVLKYAYSLSEKYNKPGIYRSCDNGLTWQPFDTTGLKHHRFGHISVSPDGFIFVSGENGGLYRSRDKFVSVEEKPKPSDEIVTTPNPASEFVEISVGANGRSPLQSDIKILNLYGQTILSVEVQNLEPLRIDVSALPPGMYFVRIYDKVSKFVKL